MTKANEATAKPAMTLLDVKGTEKLIVSIKGRSAKLDADIHLAACSALQHHARHSRQVPMDTGDDQPRLQPAWREVMTEIEQGEKIYLVSDERWSYDVVEWIDRDGQHGFEVFELGHGKGFAEQMQDKARRLMMYEVENDTCWDKSDVYQHVRYNPQLEADRADD